VQFLFKSTHHSWRYERKCEWVFFSEHSVDGNWQLLRHDGRGSSSSIQRTSLQAQQHITYVNIRTIQTTRSHYVDTWFTSFKKLLMQLTRVIHWCIL